MIELWKQEVVLDSVISAEAKKPTPLLLKEEPKEYDVQSPVYLSPLLQTGQAQSYPATHARALMSAAPPRKRHQFSETATAGCHMNVLLNPAEKDLSSLVTPYKGNRCFVSGVQVNDPALLPQVEGKARNFSDDWK
ncbi:hypothetical protein QJS10_CPB15g01517 [Acorus calamus]|uniref:Uncharacterized protein n=1 Tax=Acorus calamus TaxID=4465 RepID=A0AAV9D5S2_ACOCL|nr:hypothetical protein QJS10_CPB15g01517 [Acorus calamus]